MLSNLNGRFSYSTEAERQEQINKASGEAAAMLAVAEARAQGLKIVSGSLTLRDGKNAAALSIAEQYVHAFDKLAKTNNTLILPSNVGDVSSFVAQAMTIYKHVMPPTKENLNDQSSITDRYNPSSVSIESAPESDEIFEYFSDKEEADKHRNSSRNSKPHSSKYL